MGLIRLEDMQFYSFHGATDEEQRLGQRFEVDLELEYDFTAARESDRIEDAVDYAEVYKLVGRIMENDRFNLIETLAGAVRDGVLDRFPEVDWVLVRVRKPSVPLGGVVGFAEAEVEGERKPGP